ncbi:hypothetical protein [Mycetohabitans sp. B46]|uniref:hypothetical protein n=1 Tax=Mycetohabitans sp. B46 TaxID=2772536 RepID=UPI00307E3A4A
MIRGTAASFDCLAQNALAVSSQPANVGVILGHPRGLVLIDRPNGLRLPTGDCLPPASNVASLRGVLDNAQPRAPVRIVPLTAISWNELRDDVVVSMLERYVIERSED